jgi:uncharacterized membrane protein YphA (DoxX/SURF4 family)
MIYSKSKFQITIVLLRVALGVVFVYAAWLKLRESWLLFAMAIDAYQLLPTWAVLATARTLPWAELILGLLLIAGKWLRTAALATSGILVVFMAAMIRTYIKGMQIDCGCFGAGDTISPVTLTRDGLLLAASVALSWIAIERARRKPDSGPASG